MGRENGVTWGSQGAGIMLYTPKHWIHFDYWQDLLENHCLENPVPTSLLFPCESLKYCCQNTAGNPNCSILFWVILVHIRIWLNGLQTFNFKTTYYTCIFQPANFPLRAEIQAPYASWILSWPEDYFCHKITLSSLTSLLCSVSWGYTTAICYERCRKSNINRIWRRPPLWKWEMHF